MDIIDYVYMVVGILVAGEALALYVGLFIIGKARSVWITPKNTRYLIADGLTGIVILPGIIWNGTLWFAVLSAVFILPSLVFHFQRTFDYLMKRKLAFCANQGLFVVNNLKLVLLFGLLFIVLPF